MSFDEGTIFLLDEYFIEYTDGLGIVVEMAEMCVF
jgi:hypothetical protein